MIVEFGFEWGTRLTEDQAARLAPVLRGENRELLVGPDPVGEDGKTVPRWWSTLSADITSLLQAVPDLANKISLRKADVTPMLWESILERLDALAGKRVEQPPRINHVVNVAIPNVGLLLINKVRVEEDCCTDRLQACLDEGWRILAICPQEQRRPDYILGMSRTEPDNTERV